MSETITRSDSHQPDTDNWSRELTKDLLLHTDNLFHQRVNIFLLAEAIFFAAFGSVWGSTNDSIKYVVCIVALVLTPAFWWPLRRLRAALDFYVQKFKTFRGNEVYVEAIGKGVDELPSSEVFTFFIPVVVGLSWVVLLFLI